MEAAVQAVSHPGLPWLLGAAMVAGMVRGFSGFGAALLFLPVGARFLDPVSVIVVLICIDILGPAPLLRRAMGQADLPQTVRMALGGLVGLPLGVWLLTRTDPTAFRWIVSGLAFGLLCALASGWRHRGRRGPGLELGVGGLSGALGGFVGLPGPPVLLFLLSGQQTAARIRASILIFFVVMDIGALANFWMRDLLSAPALWIGAVLALPYLVSMQVGAALFGTGDEVVFRRVAYTLIAVAALSGLPVFDGTG